MHRLLPLPLLALCACAEDYDALVDDWVASTGQTFSDCGAVELGQCSGQDETVEAPEAISCLLEAFAACEPVRADITRPTIEGDPILSTFFVLPEGEGCGLVVFIDSREDAFGSQEIDRYACTELTEATACPWYEYGGCGDPAETW